MAKKDHPQQALTFRAKSPGRVEARASIEANYASLVASRNWTIGPPLLSWEQDRLEGVLWLHSALPPWGDELPIEDDEDELEEARALVKFLEAASVQAKVEIDMELDSDFVGEIADGHADDGIQEILLGEWARMLEQRRHRT